MNDELINKMAERSHRCYYDTVGMELVGLKLHKYLAEKMLTVVLADIKERPSDFVEMCPECDGSGKFYDVRYLENPEICSDCKGFGLVAVERKG